AFLGDTVAENTNLIGIKDNIVTINEKPSLKAYPNPASSTTTLEYNISKASEVKLQVYDMNSRLVSSINKGRQSAGVHSQELNVQNLKSGIYMVRIITNNSTSTAKLIVK
ncbi:MAG: T9SS type A sorting domain-containing protein, partial [Bacteroidaceae bacterium]|nr:T9SS type A sorting domain-containing protein [Bacteroidaceae bacterium]